MSDRRIHFRSALLGGLVAALMVGVLPPVTAAIGDALRLGQLNGINQRTTLRGSPTTANLRIFNTGAGTALDLIVEPGTPPMSVNSGARVAGLNADRVDGRHADDLVGTCQQGSIAAYAKIDVSEVLASKSVNGVVESWSCTGQQILISKTIPGTYSVLVDADADPIDGADSSSFAFGPPVVTNTQPSSNAVVIAGEFLQCAPSPPPAWTCSEVHIRDADGLPADTDFTIIWPGALETGLK